MFAMYGPAHEMVEQLCLYDMVNSDEDAAAVAFAHVCSLDAGIQVGPFYLPTCHCNLTADEIADCIHFFANLFIYTGHDDALWTACSLPLL